MIRLNNATTALLLVGMIAAIGARIAMLMLPTNDSEPLVVVAKPEHVSPAALAAPEPNSCPLPPIDPATLSPGIIALRCAVHAVAEQTGQVRQIHGRAVTRAIPYWFAWDGWDPYWDACVQCGSGRFCNRQVAP